MIATLRGGWASQRRAFVLDALFAWSIGMRDGLIIGDERQPPTELAA